MPRREHTSKAQLHLEKSSEGACLEFGL